MDGTEKSLFKIVGTTMKHFASYVYLKALQAGESIRLRVYNKVDDVSQWKFDNDVTDSVGSNNGTITNISSWVSQWKFDSNVNDSIGSNNGTITYHTNLKRLYKFESNLNDSTGGANATVAAGSISYVTGKEGNAGSFNGSTYATASDTGLSSVNAAWSVTGWVYPTNLSVGNAIFFWGTNGTHNGTNIYLTSGKFLRVDDTTSILLTSTGTLQQNNWTHFSVTWDGTTLKIYLNGVLDSSATPGAMNITLGGASGEHIASYSDNTINFNGNIDELRNYNVSLTQAQVSALYMNGKFAQSHTFDGGETISFPSGSVVSGTGDRSFSFWINPTNIGSTTKGVWGYGAASNNNALGIALQTNGVITAVGFFNDVNSNSAIVNNIWTHIVLTVSSSGTVRKIYINGVLDKTATTTALNTTSSSLTIGNDSPFGDANISGQIDEFHTYNSALSDSQVLGLYNYTGSNFVTPLPAGNALSLDGSSYVTVTNQTPYNFERTNSFSISGWIKTTSNTLGIITKDNGDGTKGYQINLNASGKITVRIVNTASTNEIQVTDSGAAINDGNWHNFILTYSGTSLASGVTLYIDGISRSLSTNTNNLSATIQNTNNIIIGANGDASSKFTGLIDEVQIWNYVLSSAEINAINAGRFANTHNIGYWKFDGDLTDSSGQGSTGSPTGTMTYVTGALSGSYGVPNTHFNFDGSEYVLVSSPIGLPTNNNSWSFSYWLNPDTFTATQFCASFGTSSGEQSIACGVNTSGNVYVSSWATALLTSTTVLTVGLWYHIVVTWDGITLKCYINGVQDATTATPASRAILIGNITIGGNTSNGNLVSGHLDDLRIYNRTLSSAEVSDLFTYPDSEMKSLVYDKTYSGTVTDAKFVPFLPGNDYMVTATQTGGTNRIVSWEREEVS